VADPLAGQDREFAEPIDEVLERAGTVFAPADDPCFTTLLVVNMVQLDL